MKMLHLCKFLLLFVGCCLLLSYSGSLGCGAGGLGSAAVDTGAVDSTESTLSNTESSLLEEGPVEIPVGIARNSGVNPSLVDSEISLVSAELNRSSTRFVTAATCTTTYAFSISGRAGAVTNGDLLVYVNNVTLGTSETGPVNADGSFDAIVICAELTDDITVSTINSTLDDAAVLSSPFFRILPESTGVIASLYTNSSSLSFSLPITYDASGGFYTTVVNDDGTFDIARLHQNGTSLEVVEESSTQMPVYMASTIAGKLAWLDETGLLMRSEPSDALGDVRASSTSGSTTTWVKTATSINIDDTLFSGDAASFSAQLAFLPQHGFSMNATEGTLGLVMPSVRADGTAYGDKLAFIKDDNTTISADTNSTDLFFGDYGNESLFFYLQLQPSPGAGKFVNIDVPQLEASSDLITSSTVLGAGLVSSTDQIDASEDGTSVVYIDDLPVAGFLSNVWLYRVGEATVQFNNVNDDTVDYDAAKVSDGGEFVILCGTPPDEPDSHNLYIYRPALDALGTITLLAGERQQSYCNPEQKGSFAIDHDGNVIFYYIDMVTETTQIGIIFAETTTLISDAL